MSPYDMRLECLRLAHAVIGQGCPEVVTKAAKEFYRFFDPNSCGPVASRAGTPRKDQEPELSS